MKIAIVSDTHDNMDNLKKVLDYLAKNKIKKIIYLGDICQEETLEYLLRKFNGEIYVVLGNAETFQIKNLKLKVKNNKSNLKICNQMGIFEIDKIKIGFAHSPKYIQKLIKDKPEYIFYGHTHKPWVEAKEYRGKKMIIANPGNLLGQPYQATFAILDTKNKRLKLEIISQI